MKHSVYVMVTLIQNWTNTKTKFSFKIGKLLIDQEQS